MKLKFAALAKKAIQCRECFRDHSIHVDLAQPRWAGPEYGRCRPRILIVLLNPGAGASRRDGANSRLRDLLRVFRAIGAGLDRVLRHQASDIANWGNGRFSRFYLDGLGLGLNQVAFANVAWCAREGNQYPATMLRRCFDRHTRQPLAILRPDIVLLSGRETHRFATQVEESLPGATVITMLHYAHRAGRKIEAAELRRVRAIIARLGSSGGRPSGRRA